jgi:sporulation protein YlmC with PRC-barrel domain
VQFSQGAGAFAAARFPKKMTKRIKTMNKNLLIAMLGVAGTLSAFAPAHAQVAGSTNVGVAITEVTALANGWSAKKSILGKTVYNDAGEKVGKVEDLIITPEKYVSYVIIGAGGFIGIGRHDVAVQFAQIREKDGKIVLPGATKDAVKAMPKFEYASDTSRHDKFVAGAEKDIAATKEKMAAIEKKATSLSGEAKAGFDKQVAALKQDTQAAEEKMGEMKRAGEKKWAAFETDVSKAIARMKKSLEKATA